MVAREGRSVGDALSVVTAAEAPFVQVPSHINIKDGQVSLINNDHTILGLRASACLMPYLPEKYRLLPLLQSVWYIPAGLDIWNQLAGKYPGRYATMKGLNVPPPDYGPVVWQDDHEPIREDGSRGAVAFAHDRHRQRRRAALLRAFPRLGRGRAAAPHAARAA
jgi:peptidoglycan/xylan/chitin deacetylase (PgdA/CDA1 family)